MEAIKKKYPDALMLCETWGEASRMLGPDGFDCAMNYLFRDAMISGKYCHGITVDRCRFTKCAGDCAVDFNGCEPGRDFEITVADSEFTLMGCRAFRAVGPKGLTA